MIPKPIQGLKCRGILGVPGSNFGNIEMKVPQQRHGSEGFLGGGVCAMKVLHTVEYPVLVIHHPVYRIAGARCLGMVKRLLEIGSQGLELEQLRLNGGNDLCLGGGDPF